jgi:arginine/lysine/ornithine decarboxylase
MAAKTLDLCLEMPIPRETQLCQKALHVSGQPAGTAHHGSRGVPCFVKNKVERVPMDSLRAASSRSASSYPPGIPVLMPGEEANAAVCEYLQGLEAFDDRFPGFEHEIHGLGTPAEIPAKGRPEGNRYWVYCLPADAVRPARRKAGGRSRSQALDD